MKFMILDRDGVIIKDKHYVHLVEDLELLPGALSGLGKLQNKLGFRFVVVTNQAGIARGLYATYEADQFNSEMTRRLGAFGIRVEKVYFCPHHPEFTGKCDCRKPKTGLVLQAAKEFGFNPSECVFVGDKDSDIQLGRNCGGVTVLVDNKQYAVSVAPDYIVGNLDELYSILAVR